MFSRRHSRMNRGRLAAQSGGASVFTPPSGLAFWADASIDYLTLTGSDVDVWADRNGSASTLIPTSGTDKPASEAAGLAGLPSVRFDRAATEAVYSQAAGLGDLASGTNEPYTIISVAQYVSVPAAISYMFAWGSSASNNPQILMGHDASGRHAIFKRNDAVATADLTASSAADTSPHVYTWKSTGTAATLYIDGVPTSISSTAQSAGALTVNRFGVGAVMKAAPAGYSDVRVPEFLVFDSALSDASRENVEAYLFDKYSITPGNELSGTLDVVVIAGQSNALGAASATGQIFPNARYLRHDITVSEPTELAALGPSGTNTMGLERELVEDMQADGRTVAIIKAARSSTLIANWQDGQTYGEGLRDAHTLGISLLQSFYGGSPTIRTHFVWVHGEQDGMDGGTAAAYEGALRTFLAGLDTYWGTSVHVHVVQLSTLATAVTNNATIRTAQATVTGEQAHYHMVDPGAAAYQGDNLHYSTAGYNSLGALVATSILGTIP